MLKEGEEEGKGRGLEEWGGWGRAREREGVGPVRSLPCSPTLPFLLLSLPGSAEGGLTYGGKVILLLYGEVSSRL